MPDLYALSDLFGDLVIYRDLNAVDERLPRFAEAWGAAGLRSAIPPRKQDTPYAQVLAWLLRRARAIGAPGTELAEIVYLGDTLLSDGGAFKNLRALTGWRGWAFIGAENDKPPAVAEEELIWQTNRWGALPDFLAWLGAQGAKLDARTVAIVDIDKTALGARGRNDKAIDRARVAAIEATLSEALGGSFDPAAFRAAYATLNVAQYHPFTADNQDNLAYVCLMLSAGVIDIETLLAGVGSGRFLTHREFMAHIDEQRAGLPSGLSAIHDEVYGRVRAGDLTPFKAFRRREYVETVARMGSLGGEDSGAARLLDEICITREVYETADWLRARGCLMVALSDKPDEATAPTPDLAAQGYLPLHRTRARMLGQPIAATLRG